jgi:hypothetical protein
MGFGASVSLRGCPRCSAVAIAAPMAPASYSARAEESVV